MGYSSGRKSSSLKTPSGQVWGESGCSRCEDRSGQVWRYRVRMGDVLWNGLPSGPWMVTSKYLRLSSWGAAEIPGAGSATSRSVS